MTENFSEKSTQHELFHAFMKCSRLLASPGHGGMGFGHGGGHRHHHQGCENHHGGHGHQHMFDEETRGMSEFCGNHFKEHCMGHKYAILNKIGQGRLLILLLENNGISQKDLAEKLNVAPASVSELINKLEKGNLIEKRQNEDDKRITNIFLTEGGDFLAKKIKEEHDKFSKDIFSGLTEEEQEQLLALIKKLFKSLSERAEKEDFSEDDE